MGNNRITNLAHPRNPKDSTDHERDAVTAGYFYEYIAIADRNFLQANKDNVLDGRLDMKQHKIIGLADPVDSYDAVNERYVASRIQALVDENTQIRRRIDR